MFHTVLHWFLLFLFFSVKLEVKLPVTLKMLTSGSFPLLSPKYILLNMRNELTKYG